VKLKQGETKITIFFAFMSLFFFGKSKIKHC